jgi:hypothetical protein
MVSLLIDNNFILVREYIKKTFHQHPKIPQFCDAEYNKMVLALAIFSKIHANINIPVEGSRNYCLGGRVEIILIFIG